MVILVPSQGETIAHGYLAVYSQYSRGEFVHGILQAFLSTYQGK